MPLRFELEKHVCLLCGQFCKNRKAVAMHLSNSHSRKILDYIVEFLLPDGIPCCKCGCGKQVQWHKSQFQFNDYLTGHNRSGFVKPGYRLTAEQIDGRNAAIRAAYSEKGKEIASKISVSVTDAFKDPKKLKKLSEGIRAAWRDPAKRDSMTASKQRTWDEQHDELVAKIFTPAFGAKISEANQRRNNKPTSRAEKAFMESIRSNGLVVNEDHWMNLKSGRKKCFDAEIEGSMVEFDGTFFHAQKIPAKGLYPVQISSLAGDIEKALICRDRGIELLRVWEGTDPRDLKSLDSIRAVTYSTVSKSGEMVGIPHFEDEQVFLPRTTLLRWRRNGGFDYIVRRVLPALQRFVVAHVSAYGWFYPSVPGGLLLDDVDALRTRAIPSQRDLTNGRPGRKSLGARFKSFWQADNGPAVAFANDGMLTKVLAYRIGLGPSKDYTYELPDGTSVTGPECFDISLSMVRRGYVMRRGTVSWFAPSLAVDIMNLLDVPRGATVWDPSGGFGGRMLGTFARDPTSTYICNEPARLTSSDLMALGVELQGIDSRFHARVIDRGSELWGPDPMSCDLVLTSPPYHDLERYFDEPGQCWRDFPSAKAWASGYVLPTVRNAFVALKPGGRMVLNVDGPHLEPFIAAAASVGFVREPELDMRLMLRRDHMNRAGGATDQRSEPIVVWRRP